MSSRDSSSNKPGENRMSIETKAVALLALGFAAAHTFAADGRDILKQQCVSCHAVAKPENASLERLWDRKGPDLYYAGAKFNREWLVKWLQNPVAIRPAGVFYGKAVKAGEQKSADVIDTAKVVAHPKLAKDDAAAAADALMTLGANDNLVEKGAFKAGPANASMAAMLFNKLRGCASCHSDKPHIFELVNRELKITVIDQNSGSLVKKVELEDPEL